MKKEIKERIEREFNIEVKEIEVVKTNDIKLNGISLIKNEIGITYYPTEEITEKNIEKELEKIRNILNRECPFNINNIPNSKEEILKNAYPELINTERNTELLKEIISLNYADLSIIFNIKITDEYSFKLTKKCAEKLGITKNDLIFELLPIKNDEIKIKGLQSFLLKQIELPKEFLPEKEIAYIVNTKNNKFGASVVLHTDFPEKIKKITGWEEFYVIPSSIYEVIIMEKTENNEPKELRKIIKEVNNREVNEEDFLSDNLYEITKNSTLLKKVEINEE